MKNKIEKNRARKKTEYLKVYSQNLKELQLNMMRDKRANIDESEVVGGGVIGEKMGFWREGEFPAENGGDYG